VSVLPAPSSLDRTVDRPVRRTIDPRGQRLAASVTSVVLAAVLLAGASGPAVWLLAAQLVVFALGAVLGAASTPYAWVFRRFVRPRLGPPAELEDPRPPRFAQTVGLVFSVLGLAAILAGLTTAGLVAVGLALAAAFLNAAFGLCLGCEVYLLLRRATGRRTSQPSICKEVSA
jgi:hypothetical protein